MTIPTLTESDIAALEADMRGGHLTWEKDRARVLRLLAALPALIATWRDREELRALLAQAEEALEPFATTFTDNAKIWGVSLDAERHDLCMVQQTIGQCRLAYSAITAIRKAKG